MESPRRATWSESERIGYWEAMDHVVCESPWGYAALLLYSGNVPEQLLMRPGEKSA